jgi:hypothetical protein
MRQTSVRIALAIAVIVTAIVVAVGTKGRASYAALGELRPEPSHLPLLLLGWIMISWIPILWRPWFPLKGHPMIRLTVAADPALRILRPVPVGEGLVAARHEAR